MRVTFKDDLKSAFVISVDDQVLSGTSIYLCDTSINSPTSSSFLYVWFTLRQSGDL